MGPLLLAFLPFPHPRLALMTGEVDQVGAPTYLLQSVFPARVRGAAGF